MLFILPSCESHDIQQNYDIDKVIANNNQKITIKTGLTGTLLKKEGNCMPSPVNSSCKQYPVSRSIYIFDYSTLKNVVGYGPFFTSVNSNLIGKCKADDEGFFQFSLSPGKYSIFILEDNKYFANGLDGLGGINPVIVKADSVITIKLILDYAVY